MPKRRRPKSPPVPGYRTQVGIADVWTVDDPVEIPHDLPSWVTREDYVAHVRSTRKTEYLGNLVLRMMVESIGLYQFCGDDACCRAGGCRSRRVECWERHNDLLRATVLPEFKQAMHEPGGPPAPTDRDGTGVDPDWDPRRHAAWFRAMQAKRAAGAPSRRRRRPGPQASSR